MQRFYTYIITNKKNGVLYTGISNDQNPEADLRELARIGENSLLFDIKKVVWFEEFNNEQDAYFRESEINSWNRIKKIELIESVNPEWENLAIHPHSSDVQ